MDLSVMMDMSARYLRMKLTVTPTVTSILVRRERSVRFWMFSVPKLPVLGYSTVHLPVG